MSRIATGSRRLRLSEAIETEMSSVDDPAVFPRRVVISFTFWSYLKPLNAHPDADTSWQTGFTRLDR